MRTTALEMLMCAHTRGCAFMHGRFCKTARERQLGWTRSYELSVGISQSKNTDCSVIPSHCLWLLLFLHRSPNFCASLPQSPYHPCSLLAPARSCSLHVASQPLCTRELIHLYHPRSEWQTAERRRLQKSMPLLPTNRELAHSESTANYSPCSGE